VGSGAAGCGRCSKAWRTAGFIDGEQIDRVLVSVREHLESCPCCAGQFNLVLETLQSIEELFLTEFGRTPKINSNGGRDHWGAAGSIFFAGGGTRGGQVIGATDRHGAFPTTYTPADVAATVYKALGVDPETRIFDVQNVPHSVLDHGAPIAGVL
jgi:hypothetical protein